MRFLTFFTVTTTVSAVALGATASAQNQSKAAAPRKALSAKAEQQRSMNALRNRPRNLAPPAPPLLRRRGSSRSAVRNANPLFGRDNSGRSDLVGKAVPFYPSIRTLEKGQKSASRAPRQSAPRENAQKNMLKP